MYIYICIPVRGSDLEGMELSDRPSLRAWNSVAFKYALIASAFVLSGILTI
jgi:hypothetical protein